MVKRPADTAAQLSAILWSALGYLAKKRANKSLLTVGPATKVDVLIEGKVGRKKISERVCGELKLNADTSRAETAAADASHVVALLLLKLPDETARAQAIADIIAAKESKKGLPAVTPEQLDNAAQFLTRLRSSTTKKVSGSQVFTLAAKAATAAALLLCLGLFAGCDGAGAETSRPHCPFDCDQCDVGESIDVSTETPPGL
jgi:uncharacterized low-complexity protein